MNTADLEARLIFKNETARHAFMMKAIDKEDFVYRLVGGDGVVMSRENAERLMPLAKRFGGAAAPPEKPVTHDVSQIPDREERIKSWNALAEEILSLKVA